MTRFLHVFWLPLAHLANPLWLGQRSLRAMLGRNGVDPRKIPLDAISALAARSLEIVKIKSGILKWGVFKELAEYTDELEFVAEQVGALLFLEDRTHPFLRGCHSVMVLLQRWGIAVLPVRSVHIAEAWWAGLESNQRPRDYELLGVTFQALPKSTISPLVADISL